MAHEVDARHSSRKINSNSRWAIPVGNLVDGRGILFFPFRELAPFSIKLSEEYIWQRLRIVLAFLRLIYLAASVEQIQQDLEEIKQLLKIKR